MIKTLGQYWQELEQHLPPELVQELLPVVRRGFMAGIGATMDFHRSVYGQNLSPEAQAGVLQAFTIDWEAMVHKAMLEDLGPGVCAQCENADTCDHVGHPEIDVMQEGQTRPLQ